MPWNRSATLVILLCGLLALATIAPVTAGASGNLAEVQSDLAAQLALGGPHDGAYVYDLTARRVIFSERAATLRPPASVEKLFTATAVLAQMGPSTRLSTSVLGVGRLAPGGVWEGSLYLRGGGDPTFGSPAFIAAHYGGQGASVTALAAKLVRDVGIHHITGSIEGDESYFDAFRGEPSSGYAPDPFLEGTLSALAFNRGKTGSARGAHAPAAFAARELWRALKNRGVSIRGASGDAVAPPGALSLAEVRSPTVAQLLGLMLPPSDNFFAETLLKDLGARAGGTGTTASGAAAARTVIEGLLGIHPRLVDGSGLSPADRTSPFQVADLLAELSGTALGTVLREHMAIAGHTGTLTFRMRGTRAAGNCQAKTGTLTGVSNLAGYCQGEDGHLFAFAIFNDGISTESAHRYQDHMAITLADSSDGLPAAPAGERQPLLLPPD